MENQSKIIKKFYRVRHRVDNFWCFSSIVRKSKARFTSVDQKYFVISWYNFWLDRSSALKRVEQK